MSKLPIHPALIAIDLVALSLVGLCLAERFPKGGAAPLGLIPAHLITPVLIGSIGVAAVCLIWQVKAILKLSKASN